MVSGREACNVMGWWRSAGVAAESEPPATVLNRGVQRHHGMSAVSPPRKTDITHPTNQPPPGDQCPIADAPDGVQVVEELLVIGYPS